MKDKIQEKLILLGITPNLKGFHYVCEAILLIIENPAIQYEITAGIYGSLALKDNVAPATVERCIRHAISKVDKDKKEKWCGTSCPKNSEFLSVFAMKIQKEEN